MPYMIDGTPGASFVGTGLVVDAGATSGRGLVVVDRNTVPASLGDCVLHVGSSLEVPATVAFVHPLHNLAVVAFNAQLLKGVALTACELAPTATPPTATRALPGGSSGALQRLERDFLASSSSSSGEAEARAVYKNSDAAAAAALAGNGSGSSGSPGRTGSNGSESNNNNRKSGDGQSSSGQSKPRYEGLTLVSLLGNQRAGTQLTSKPVVQSRVWQGQPVAFSHPPRFQESNLDAFALEGGSQVGSREGGSQLGPRRGGSQVIGSRLHSRRGGSLRRSS